MLRCYGFPRKFVKLVQLFHNRMIGQVLYNRNTSAALAISSVIKQGCVLVLVLFNLFFACMVHQVPIGWLFHWPSLLEWIDHVPPYSHSRHPLCWWLCAPAAQSQWSTVGAEQILRRCYDLWPEQVLIKYHICKTKNHSWQHPADKGKLLQIFGKHHFKQ